jgi:hypothetical protein
MLKKRLDMNSHGYASRWRQLVVGLLLVSALTVTACSGGGGGGGSTSVNSAPTATATTKPKPTLKEITVAYCTSLLSVSEANAIIPSSTPATQITQGNPVDSQSGACNYKISASQFLLIIFFIPYSGPDPISQSDIQSTLAQAAGNSKITINTQDPVSGVGDQAYYLEMTTDLEGQSVPTHVLYVLEGSFIFDCITYGFLSPVLANESQLQQCATKVDSRL